MDPSAADRAQAGGPQDRISAAPAVLYPGQFVDEARYNRFKPGHLAAASLRLQANTADNSGWLTSIGSGIDGEPLPIGGTGLYLESARPVTLAKGETKNLETFVYIPVREAGSSSVNVRQRMTALSGIPLIDQTQPVIALRPWQFHLVVLADQPGQLRYIDRMDCIQLPAIDAVPPPPFYQTVWPARGDPVPLASHGLAWTTIGAVLWSGMDPGALTIDQQQAMVDWIHFGGQLIVSGPESLDALGGSFLAPLLPASQEGARNIGASELEELNGSWSVPAREHPDRPYRLEIPDNAPMLGVRLGLRPGAEAVEGTGGLIVERRVGRGRIVLTAFSLRDRRLMRWLSFPSLFNGALLRKPGRVFSEISPGVISFSWHRTGATTFDPRIGTMLRFVSRDLNPELSPSAATESLDPADDEAGWSDPRDFESVGRGVASERSDSVIPQLDPGFRAQPFSGLGGWNDQYGLAGAARETLSRAAGIRPPSRGFVIRMLACYIAVLVPLNWLVFRLIGRVEWAWLAAPLIAIGGAVAIVRLAALDIGFVRSETTLGLLEIPAGHRRGHLTGYSALYSSLSTLWDLDFGSEPGFGIPMSATGPDGDILRPVRLEQSVRVRMGGFPVQSNTTGLLHHETIRDLGGILSLAPAADGGLELVNQTGLELEGAGIVRCNPDGRREVAWLGAIAAGARVGCQFVCADGENLWEAWRGDRVFVSLAREADTLWKEAGGGNDRSIDEAVAISGLSGRQRDALRRELEVMVVSRLRGAVRSDSEMRVSSADFRSAYMNHAGNRDDRLSLGELFDLVTGKLGLPPGEVRLIARLSRWPGSARLRPLPTRVRSSVLVLAHLQHAPLPAPERDRNVLRDLLKATDQDEFDKSLESPVDDAGNQRGRTSSPSGEPEDARDSSGGEVRRKGSGYSGASPGAAGGEAEGD